MASNAIVATEASAQSVLRVARGLASNDISVLINRAVVIDSAEAFTEVSVAQPEIADVSPLSDRSLYIFGRARGATTLTLLGEGGRLITNVLIRVQPDLGELKARLTTLLPGEPIEVRTAGGGLVLSGVVSGKAKIDKAMALARAYSGNAVTNMMTVGGTQQVNLRAKIAEVDRDAAKDLGISTQFRATSGNAAFDGTTGDQLDTAEEALRPTPGNLGGPSIGTLFDPIVGFGSLGALFSITDSFLFDLRINALESKGFARSLAEPNIVALSGEEASLLVGGEVPIPTVNSDNGTVSVEFKNVGVSLNFVPTVVDEDLINISLSAEVSSVDPGVTSDVEGVTVFGFDTQRATTVVELRDGQSFAIAGLIENSFTDTIDQVPLLGDLPVLGPLFRSTSFTRGDSEFVIVITASLVVPVDDENELSLPTDRIGIPNEFDLFFFGKTEVLTPAGRQVAGQGFDGDYGYVVE
ncbi:MAG: type II and III secretion system protein family protein [Pseudomonadota bacterium]